MHPARTSIAIVPIALPNLRLRAARTVEADAPWCARYTYYAPLDVRRDDGHQISHTPDVYVHRSLDHINLDPRVSPHALDDRVVQVGALPLSKV